MLDPDRERGPSTPTEWLMAGGFILVVLGLFVAEIAVDYSPVKLSALLVVLFWIPLLALHECGHAVVAFLLGWRVRQIVIGMGKTLGHFRIGTADVELKMFPIEGFVRSQPLEPSRPRFESALIYFAGPGVELLVALLVLLAVGPERLFASSQNYGMIAWQSLAVTATAGAVLNLIPFAISTPAGTLYSDGLGIAMSFLRRRDPG